MRSVLAEVLDFSGASGGLRVVEGGEIPELE